MRLGKRGMQFENALNYTNNIYKNQNRAVIEKLPTPNKGFKISR